MKIPNGNAKKIEVYYDGRCGMCCTFHEWINKQPRKFAIDFIPYQSERAEMVFPGIGMLDPARAMVVRSDSGVIYRGAEAWVMCLYSCSNYQSVAKKLAGPALLSVAIRACHVLAANRHSLSKIFFRSKDKLVRENLHVMEEPKCDSEYCVVK